jgi:hypothetical protein
MPEEVIHRLGHRGLGAGERMISHFTTERSKEDAQKEQEASAVGESEESGKERLRWRRTSWRNHRWVRLRSTLGLLERLLCDLYDQYHRPIGGAPTFGEMLSARARIKDQPSYETSAGQRDLARVLLEGGKVNLRKRGSQPHSVSLPGLFQAVETLEEALVFKAKLSLQYDAPRPEPDLRVSPGGGKRRDDAQD